MALFNYINQIFLQYLLKFFILGKNLLLLLLLNVLFFLFKNIFK